MQLNVPVDIADVVQLALRGNGVRACAEPLPRDLGERLPLTLVQQMGAGSRADVVVDRFAVRLYTYAEGEAEAIAEASRAVATLCALEGRQVGGTVLYRVTPTAQPFPADDPNRPDLARACSTAYVWARATTIDI